ncbi:putative LIM domain-containing serine/threonine-protein kinase [Tetrabaena socialis]|uniref:Putative LIM domain-containing serine/threonine-protein kinase n=1 Tax=Tetrabaena socialis TaxID=47790 RepID=A0A2J8A4P3_9CHLO|nr:putative LIM domain-containing serine/threonine-protein kinase [Tetrabaena socialis]|eukprot:PNH07489.1 putative LIM domain-containing serine/threonine-protein kinase [Tetrabaena socialis]
MRCCFGAPAPREGVKGAKGAPPAKGSTDGPTAPHQHDEAPSFGGGRRAEGVSIAQAEILAELRPRLALAHGAPMERLAQDAAVLQEALSAALVSATCHVAVRIAQRQPTTSEAMAVGGARLSTGSHAPLERAGLCLSADAVSAAASLQELVAALTGAVASTLAAGLHLDSLAVRLALLPYRDAPTGLIFLAAAVDALASRAAMSGLPSPRVSSQNHQRQRQPQPQPQHAQQQQMPCHSGPHAKLEQRSLTVGSPAGAAPAHTAQGGQEAEQQAQHRRLGTVRREASLLRMSVRGGNGGVVPAQDKSRGLNRSAVCLILRAVLHVAVPNAAWRCPVWRGTLGPLLCCLPPDVRAGEGGPRIDAQGQVIGGGVRNPAATAAMAAPASSISARALNLGLGLGTDDDLSLPLSNAAAAAARQAAVNDGGALSSSGVGWGADMPPGLSRHASGLPPGPAASRALAAYAPGGAAGKVAWKASAFTTASTLLASLLSGTADARASSALSATLPAAPATAPTPAPPLLRMAVVADVAAYLQELRQPTADVFSLVRRAALVGGGGGGGGGPPASLIVLAVEPAGAGGCSVVLLGHLHSMPVAIKVILPVEDDESDEENDNRQQAGGGDGGGGGGGGADQQERERTQERQRRLLAAAPALALAPVPAAAAAASKRAHLSTRRRTQLTALMRGARELAVMTSISHPNIVQVYSYCTRVMVVESAERLPELAVVPEGAPVEGLLCTALIMEFCDMGSLADAIDSGKFARAARMAAAAPAAPATARGPQSSGGSGAADPAQAGAGARALLAEAAAAAAAAAGTPVMRAVYLTLLEVALALRHLHAQNLVHCDVKPANVLLRSSADPRGFTAKLADFGFVSHVPANEGGGGGGGGGLSLERDVDLEPVGTVTHMSPELLGGSSVDASVDIYAFGQLEWEGCVPLLGRNGNDRPRAPRKMHSHAKLQPAVAARGAMILMWEMFTGRAPYSEHADSGFQEVPYRVAKEGLRPTFPRATPSDFRLLATECWSANVERRPPAAALVARLQALLDASCGHPVRGKPAAGPA